jgi:hypothetical protein
VFHTYVAGVSSGYCKNRSRYYIYFLNGFKCFQVFQTYVANVSTVLDVCCKCFYLDVVKIDREVAHVVMGPTCCKRLPQILGRRCGSPCGLRGAHP